MKVDYHLVLDLPNHRWFHPILFCCDIIGRKGGGKDSGSSRVFLFSESMPSHIIVIRVGLILSVVDSAVALFWNHESEESW